MEDKPVEEQKPKTRRATSRNKPSVVTNNCDHSLEMFGVHIAAGKSAEVPSLDPKKPVIAAWIKSNKITIG